MGQVRAVLRAAPSLGQGPAEVVGGEIACGLCGGSCAEFAQETGQQERVLGRADHGDDAHVSGRSGVFRVLHGARVHGTDQERVRRPRAGAAGEGLPFDDRRGGGPVASGAWPGTGLLARVDLYGNRLVVGRRLEPSRQDAARRICSADVIMQCLSAVGI